LKLELIELPNCNSGTDALTLRDGRHLLVYNHSSIEKVRVPLNIAISNDGQTWEAAAVLESEPPGQYSYPAVIQSRSGLVHVTYTWKRLRVKHVVIDPARLASEPIKGGKWPER
jgi:predicted neuraminidase